MLRQTKRSAGIGVVCRSSFVFVLIYLLFVVIPHRYPSTLWCILVIAAYGAA